MRYLITGHTGFKGTWLSLLLLSRGHEVIGLSLEAEHNSLFNSVKLIDRLNGHFIADVRNQAQVSTIIDQANAEVIIHMAAQPLVRESYLEPRKTFETNVFGTLNVLEAAQLAGNTKACLIITTDKVYRNTDNLEGYKEDDALGAADPYSTSKAMADLLTQSLLYSFSFPPTAIARAGNVIGGGDICADRLLPDVYHSLTSNRPVVLRAPDSIRPWQHVLDCINGYTMIVDDLLDSRKHKIWNIGPNESNSRTVSEVTDLTMKLWGSEKSWQQDQSHNPQEAKLLTLNTDSARTLLNWKDKLSFEESITWVSRWYKEIEQGISPLDATESQIKLFETLGN